MYGIIPSGLSQTCALAISTFRCSQYWWKPEAFLNADMTLKSPPAAAPVSIGKPRRFDWVHEQQHLQPYRFSVSPLASNSQAPLGVSQKAGSVYWLNGPKCSVHL